jgi:hypothetical protein
MLFCKLIKRRATAIELFKIFNRVKVKSYVTTDGLSPRLSWCQAPIWGPRPGFCYRGTVAGLLMWGAFSDERVDLSFTISVGPRQRNSWPSRLPQPGGLGPRIYIPQEQYGPVIPPPRHWVPFPSPPTTRRATAEVFEPTFTLDQKQPEVRVTSRLAVCRQSVRLGVEPIETHGQNSFSQTNSHSPYITSSLTIGWVCHLQLLLALARAFILGSESCGTCDHILLFQIRDFPFRRLLPLAGSRWRYSTPPLVWALCYDRRSVGQFVLE